MRKRFAAPTMWLLALAFAVPPARLVAQELTPVQRAFNQHRPLSMLEEPDMLNKPDNPDKPDKSAVAPPFVPARRSKVLWYSLELMFYEGFWRVATEAKSRAGLSGPFFKDWFDSVHIPRKWDDLDPWRVNYVGHAINGAAAARIWLDQREPRATTRRQYSAEIGRALVFATIFSELFENGPISEASIGNVAMRHDRTGWVDHVWTPVGGVLWVMAEDAIDRYVLTKIDRNVPSTWVRAAFRMGLNPGRMLANIAQNKKPWDRRDRPLIGR